MKSLDENYKIYTLVHLWNPKEKPLKALLASVLWTKHTAQEKKLSDRINAARPGEVEKRRCTGHAALTVRVGTALIRFCTAPNSKTQLNFVKHVSHFCTSILKNSRMFCNCWPRFINFDEEVPEVQHFLQKIYNNPQIIFPEFSQRKLLIFLKIFSNTSS